MSNLRVHTTVLVLLALALLGCQHNPPEVAKDEARLRSLAEGKTAEAAAREWFYPKEIHDYFSGMDAVSAPPMDHPDQLLDAYNAEYLASGDGASITRPRAGVAPPPLESNGILGRNTWMIWCAGNEGFWDWLGTKNFGFIDLLKLVDSRNRSNRFHDAGLINEPGMGQAARPDSFGLWLDIPDDAQTRTWREAYLNATFDRLVQRTHKSQRGLVATDAAAGSSSYGAPNRSEGYARPSMPRDAASQYDYGYDRPSSYVKGEGDPASYDAKIPPPDIYGVSSGVIGLRLFPNPYFDEAARRKWDAERYYNDASYYNDPSLVRPYRVGMSCAFCHASFHPLKPPRDVANPGWQNISGNIGAQYLSMRATVGNLLTPDLFAYHLLESQPRGTIDTSLIASDNINNPNTFNAVFSLPQRALLSFRNPPERQSTASQLLPSLWANPATSSTPPNPDNLPEGDPQSDGASATFAKWGEVFEQQGLLDELASSNGSPRFIPRVLLDGSDGIGAFGALARVYLNIGSYWERWNQLHQPILGITPQQPFTIHDCETNSVYWHATKLRVGAMRDYFLNATPPMPLLSTPNGVERLKPIDLPALEKQAAGDPAKLEALTATARARHIDLRKLADGRRAFARNCIVCHSSIQPESGADTLFGSASSEERTIYETRYQALIDRRVSLRNEWAKRGEHWEHNPGQWLQDDDYMAWAEEIVEKPAFWQWNYLSTDYRVPITQVKTNAARALATNAVQGHMWEDFASDSYRRLPSVGPIEYFNPYAGDEGAVQQFEPRHRVPGDIPSGGGGPGFYRVPTLVSIWATAPFLHNNSLGLYNNDPSVDGRLAAFDDAIRKLLYPDRRLQSSSYNEATSDRLTKDRGLIWRTTEDSYLVVNAKLVPFYAKRLPLLSSLSQYAPWLDSVQPLWLPSASLFLAALLLLGLRTAWWRRFFAVLALGAALLLASFCFLQQSSSIRWLGGAGALGIAAVVFVILAVGLLLPLSHRKRRGIAYAAVVCGLLGGALLYLNAGQLGELRLGPIPRGTPVNLFANVNPEADPALLRKAVATVAAGLAEIESRHLNDVESAQVMRERIAPALLSVSKCPDFVMDRGHYFDWFSSMTDDDKEALIELLKTF